MPILIDRWRSATSRVVTAYGLLCLFFISYLVLATTILNSFPVDGTVSLQTVTSESRSETFPVARLGSNSCDANEKAKAKYCSQTLNDVATAKYTISSANCGSNVETVAVDQNDRKCVLVSTHLQGCGYDRLPFGINNCKGRGWLEYQVTAFGSVPQTSISDRKKLAGSVRTGRPLIFNPNYESLSPNQTLLFDISIDVKGKKIRLTSEKSSSDGFSASLLPSGEVQVTYAPLGS